MKLDPTHNAAETARTLLPKMARKYFEAGRKAVDQKRPPDELHAFRLETKRFRYTLELFKPLYGPGLDRYVSALRGLQGALGKVSDYQAIARVLGSDRQLKMQIDRAIKGKLKDLRRTWRAFDSPGELKRWRSYLGSEYSKPRPKRAAPASRKKAAVRETSSKALSVAAAQ